MKQEVKEEMKKENKLGIMPINKLVLNMSLPLIVSMLIQALYNFVDSFFVAQIPEVGQSAITALSLALPFQILIIAITTGTGIGINAMLSRRLGEKNIEAVNNIAGNSFFIAIFSSAIFVFFGTCLVRPYFEIQTTNVLIIDLGVKYFSIIAIFSGVKVLQIFLERMLQATGRAKLSMVSQGSSAILNLIFDPIFIFYFGMGVEGAAIATILAQTIGVFVVLGLNLKYNKEIKFARKYLKLDFKIIKEIYEIGLPAIIMQGIQSLMFFVLNSILYGISEVTVTAYGIFFRIQELFLMPVIGISAGIIPIVSYNLGARKPERIKKGIVYGIKFGLLIMVFGMVVLELFPKEVFGIFKPSKELLNVGVACIKISALSYVFLAPNIILQASLQSLGFGRQALYVSLLRSVVILVPVAYLISRFSNAEYNIWWAFVISEVIALIVATKFLIYDYKTKLKSN